MASSAQPPHASSGPALDNRRVAAAAIDLAAPGLALVALYAGGLLTPAVALVLVGWTLYYFFALESGGGQTIGKRVLNLRVVDADNNEPSMRQVAMRTVVRIVDLPVIGLIAMMASGDRRQRLGDMAAETHVVDAAPPRATSDFTQDTHRLDPQVPAAFAEPPVERPKRARRTLGGPELKLPTLRRKPKRAQQPTAATLAPLPVGEAKAEKPKRSRPSLGGPELKLPKLGRKRAKPAAAAPPVPMPEPPAAPEPEPEPHQPDPAPLPAGEVPDAVEAFGLYDDDQPEPDVEIVAEEPWVEPYGEPAHDDAEHDLTAEVPVEFVAEAHDVQVTPEPEMAPEPEVAPVPSSHRPAAVPAIPAAERAPLPAPRPPSVPAALDPQRPPREGDTAEFEDFDRPAIEVKPIETVSAMDLIMQDAEQHRRG